MNRNRPGSFSPRGVLALLLVLGVSLSTSSGCAMFKEPVPPGFDKISLEVRVARDRHGVLEGDLTAHSTLKGILVGLALGGPTLALVAGGTTFGISLAACAPPAAAGFILAPIIYVMCVFVATAIATVAGFVVGLTAGGIIGGVGGLPSKTAEQVNAVLANLEEGRRFDDDLMGAMRAAIPAKKQVESRKEASSEALVIAKLKEFDLRQHSKDRLSIRLLGSMVQKWWDDGEEKKKTCRYRYDSERDHADRWLADGGVAFGGTVTKGLETLARWMNRDLEAFATEKQFDESENGDPESCFREPHWYDWLIP